MAKRNGRAGAMLSRERGGPKAGASARCRRTATRQNLAPCGLFRFALGGKALRESIKGSRIAGIHPQVLAIDGLRLLRPSCREQLSAERFAHRVIPNRRLLVDERVLQTDSVGKFDGCVLMVAASCRELPSNDGDRDFGRRLWRDCLCRADDPRGIAATVAVSCFCSLIACARSPFALYAIARA